MMEVYNWLWVSTELTSRQLSLNRTANTKAFWKVNMASKSTCRTHVTTTCGSRKLLLCMCVHAHMQELGEYHVQDTLSPFTHVHTCTWKSVVYFHYVLLSHHRIAVEVLGPYRLLYISVFTCKRCLCVMPMVITWIRHMCIHTHGWMVLATCPGRHVHLSKSFRFSSSVLLSASRLSFNPESIAYLHHMAVFHGGVHHTGNTSFLHSSWCVCLLAHWKEIDDRKA